MRHQQQAPALIVAGLLLAVQLIGLCSAGSRPISEYMRIHEPSSFYESGYDWIRRQAEVLSGDVRLLANHFKQTCDLLATGRAPADYDGDKTVLLDVLLELEELADEQKTTCNNNMLHHYFGLIQSSGSSMEDFLTGASQSSGIKHIGHYLRKLGAAKFVHCTESNMLKLEGKVDRDAERALDKMVAANSDKRAATSLDDVTLRALAAEMDFVAGENVHLDRMTVAIETDLKTMISSPNGYRSKLAPLTRYIMDSCAKLTSPLRDMLNTYILGRVLGGQEQLMVTGGPMNGPQSLSDKFAKLSEYGRMCFRFQDNSEQINKIIKDKTKWYKLVGERVRFTNVVGGKF